MVERVEEALGALLDYWVAGRLPTADLARAAIQAMREPSEAMVDALDRVPGGWGVGIDAALAAPDEGQSPCPPALTTR